MKRKLFNLVRWHWVDKDDKWYRYLEINIPLGWKNPVNRRKK